MVFSTTWHKKCLFLILTNISRGTYLSLGELIIVGHFFGGSIILPHRPGFTLYMRMFCLTMAGISCVVLGMYNQISAAQLMNILCCPDVRKHGNKCYMVIISIVFFREKNENYVAKIIKSSNHESYCNYTVKNICNMFVFVSASLNQSTSWLTLHRHIIFESTHNRFECQVQVCLCNYIAIVAVCPCEGVQLIP